MKTIAMKAASAAAILSLTAGCMGPGTGAGGGGGSERLEVRQALAHQHDVAPANLIVQGVAVGAVVGCGLGLLLGGGGRGCAAGAAIGGAAGGVAGDVATGINDRQIASEDKQDALYAELVQEREDLNLYNAKVEEAIGRLRADHRDLRRQRASKKITAAQFDAQKASIDADIVRLQDHTASLRADVQERNEKIDEYEIEAKITRAGADNLDYIDRISRDLDRLDQDV